MSGTIVAAGPAPPTPNGVAQPSGVPDPARGGGKEIPAERASAATGLRPHVVQHFIGDGDSSIRARAESEAHARSAAFLEAELHGFGRMRAHSENVAAMRDVVAAEQLANAQI